MQVAKLLKEQGYGVIMNTHAPEQAINEADYAIFLQKGKVKVAGKPDEIIHSELISEIYNTKIELLTAYSEDGTARKVCVAM